MVFYSLFGVVSDEIWRMIKTTAPYQLPRYKTLELVVESKPISSSDNYDPTNISGSSNPVMAEERTQFRAREQRPSRVSIQNVDADDEVEEWHLDVEEDDIQDAIDINMDETNDAVDIKETIKEWQMSVSFINRGIKHPWHKCAIVENMWHKCVEWFYQRRQITAAWEAQGLVFSQNVTELIKHRGDKGTTYDVIPLDWGINNFNVYNKNGLIEMIIFYTYIIFYLILKFKQ
jgi:hypothetical protein